MQDCEICKCVHALSKELSDMRVVGSSNSSFVMGCRMNPICETTTTKTSTTEGNRPIHFSKCFYLFINTYIYRERQREREKERKSEIKYLTVDTIGN